MKATNIDPQLLEKATSIFAELGLPIEQAINVFLANPFKPKVSVFLLLLKMK